MLRAITGLCLLLTHLTAASAQEEEAISMSLSGATPTKPALQYRLSASTAELVRGNAAPIYLRIRHEMLQDSWVAIGENAKWLDMPLADFPVAEAARFVEGYGSRLEQIEFGTRRAECDWNYTIDDERQDVIALLLPDAQAMRNWGRLLSLKARVEIKQGNYAQAIQTIRTGIIFGQHVGDGPFLVNRLVGMAIANMMLDRVAELVQQPDAPNLYWALTSLPRPLISIRSALDVEQKIGEWMVPGLAMTDQPRSKLEWKVSFDRLANQINEMQQESLLFLDGPDAEQLKQLPNVETLVEQLAANAPEVLSRMGITEHNIQQMSQEEKAMRSVTVLYRDLRDDVFKFSYLDYPQAIAFGLGSEANLQKYGQKPGMKVFVALMPAIEMAYFAEARMERRVAEMRIIESIRAYVDAHDKLPASLAELTLPAPVDPMSGLPFEYEVADKTAALQAPRLETWLKEADAKWRKNRQPKQYKISLQE